MVAQKSGAVFDGSSYTHPKASNSIIHLHFFKNETISNTVGGAVVIMNMNDVGVTMFIDCNFHNNFGAEGGSINMNEGGKLIAINVKFSLEKGYSIFPFALRELIT